MLNPNEKKEMLEDHLPYELMMLKFTFAKMSEAREQLDYNAYYEAFVVHARNLYWFLTNDDKSNAHACEFVLGFKASKTNATISTFQDLHRQVLHIGKGRKTNREQKVQYDEAKDVFDWIILNSDVFIGRLDSTDLANFRSDRAEPRCGSYVLLGGRATASSHPAPPEVVVVGQPRGTTGPVER